MIDLLGYRTVDQAQCPPANVESIPAQAVMCARFTSKARFYIKILDQIILCLINSDVNSNFNCLFGVKFFMYKFSLN